MLIYEEKQVADSISNDEIIDHFVEMKNCHGAYIKLKIGLIIKIDFMIRICLIIKGGLMIKIGLMILSNLKKFNL